MEGDVFEIKTLDIVTSKRRGKMTIKESLEKIEITFEWDKIGKFGDEAQIRSHLFPVFASYETDNRPIHFDEPLTGQHAVIRSGNGWYELEIDGKNMGRIYE